MSCGFSVSDLVAITQLCLKVRGEIFSDTSDSSSLPSRDIEELKSLIKSLDDLADAITSTHSNRVLAQEEFQIPLRDGVARIRRHVESLSQLMKNHPVSKRARWKTISNHAVPEQTRRKRIEAIDQLSEDTKGLQLLLHAATYAGHQEILLTIETLSIATKNQERNEILQWLVESENQSLNTALVSTPDEQTVSWILEDPAYQKWRNSRDSFLWLWGKRMPPLSQVLHID